MDPLHDPINGGLVPLKNCLDDLKVGIVRIIEVQSKASPSEMLKRLDDLIEEARNIKGHPELVAQEVHG